jgi:phosphatidylinositol glycan class M
VRYTDIDYDVFTDAAEHAAHGRSPYERHTYRYTPFLAGFLALPLRYHGKSLSILLWSRKYFGKLLFSIADAICGYIIVMLRRRKRSIHDKQQTLTQAKNKRQTLSPDFVDALWWLYNPLPINICTRGSAESLVVLLPVLATVAVAEMRSSKPQESQWNSDIIFRACLAGVLHGIGIHAKLYPLIYTVSFMAYFSHQQQSMSTTRVNSNCYQTGWTHVLSELMEFFGTCFCCGPSKSTESNTFPWRHPLRIFVLSILWVQRLFLTTSSM